MTTCGCKGAWENLTKRKESSMTETKVDLILEMGHSVFLTKMPGLVDKEVEGNGY